MVYRIKSTMHCDQLGIPRLIRYMHDINGRSLIKIPKQHNVTFQEIVLEAGKLAAALSELGVQKQCVVGTLLGSMYNQLIAYLAVPGAGCILHTLNVRLHATQLAHVVKDGNDKAIICDKQHYSLAREIAINSQTVHVIIVIDDDINKDYDSSTSIKVYNYYSLINNVENPIKEWPDINENAAAIICHTGGTTGMPKGVVYSHRSLWLQANSLCTVNSIGIGATTKILPAVPLYHVNGWGLPYAAFMAGAELILPEKSMHSDYLLDVIEAYQPTIAAGVPTIWLDVLKEKQRRTDETNFGPLRTIVCGGALVPKELIAAYDSYGVLMVQGWGMTETSSLSAVASIPPWVASDTEQQQQYLTVQGRLIAGLELRVVQTGTVSTVLPHDGKTIGEIQIRGPWVTASYLNYEDQSDFDDGWLRTGDLGSVDSDGYLRLSDRLKDAIKSGGEWISSLELEKAIRLHPDVEDVAIVSVPDERWQERPAAMVVLRDNVNISTSDMSSWLSDRVAKWWIPSVWVFADELPRTSVGKVSKKEIMEVMKDYTN